VKGQGEAHDPQRHPGNESVPRLSTEPLGVNLLVCLEPSQRFVECTENVVDRDEAFRRRRRFILPGHDKR